MKINTERLLENLNKKWKNNVCPYCQEKNWTVNPEIVTPIEVGEDKGMRIGGRFQPLVSVTCQNCGNTVLVNALILDCLDDIEKMEEGESEQ